MIGQEPFLQDFATENPDNSVGSSCASLAEYRLVFDEVSEVCRVEQQLVDLRQGSSPTAKLAATFRRVTFRNEVIAFRKSVSEHGKDELATRDTLEGDLRYYISKIDELDIHLSEEKEKRKREERASHWFHVSVFNAVFALRQPSQPSLLYLY